MIKPLTQIRLLNIPIDSTNKHQLYFKNTDDQYNYMNSKVKKTFTRYTYQRKDSIFRIETPIDSIHDCNYLMYRNDTSAKWFYAFITRREYISDDVTAIHVQTDVWQTWFNNITLLDSFVEREHVADDSIGANTVPESLETGSYVCNDIVSLFTGGKNTYIIMQLSGLPDELQVNRNITEYNGIFSGTLNVAFQTTFSAGKMVSILDELGKGDAIVGIYLLPKSLVKNVNFEVMSFKVGSRTISNEVGLIPISTAHESLKTVTGITATSLNGYTPNNNKLYTYPYSYFYVSNNVGVDAEFHYEDFVGNSASFKTIGSITPGGSIRTIPLNYNKQSDSSSSLNSYNAGITFPKYPIASWSNDLYTNWQTQNAVNQGISYVGAAVAIGAGIAMMATGVGAGAGATTIGASVAGVTGGVGTIANTLAKSYEHSLVPPQARGNTNAGDVVYSASKMNMPLYKMSIRYEYAKIIDDYFTMFGYKVNKVKKPNISSRPHFNFVKTIDCNIKGNVPEEDIIKIKNIFNAGVTFWKNGDNLGNYSLTNK